MRDERSRRPFSISRIFPSAFPFFPLLVIPFHDNLMLFIAIYSFDGKGSVENLLFELRNN